MFFYLLSQASSSLLRKQLNKSKDNFSRKWACMSPFLFDGLVRKDKSVFFVPCTKVVSWVTQGSRCVWANLQTQSTDSRGSCVYLLGLFFCFKRDTVYYYMTDSEDSQVVKDNPSKNTLRQTP